MVSVLLKDRNLLFVHVPKTGGGSISRALRLEPDALLYPVSEMAVVEPCITQLSRQLARPLNEYRTVAFVRNPWDWTVSGYLQVTKNMPAYESPPTFKQFVKGNWIGATILQYPTKFKEPMAYVAYHTQITPWMHLFPSGSKGTIHHLCTFENLERDAKEVLGIGACLPHANRSERDHYSGYYDEETHELVASRHANLINIMGYTF